MKSAWYWAVVALVVLGCAPNVDDECRANSDCTEKYGDSRPLCLENAHVCVAHAPDGGPEADGAAGASGNTGEGGSGGMAGSVGGHGGAGGTTGAGGNAGEGGGIGGESGHGGEAGAGGVGGHGGAAGMGGVGGMGGMGGTPCVPSNDSVEICDEQDNNCDGTIDEGFEEVGTGCTAGDGTCLIEGHYVCEGGEAVCDAVASEPGDEACNGMDDDCDGAVDEDYRRPENSDEPGDFLGEPCGTGVGACESVGVFVCNAAEPLMVICSAEVIPPDASEVCDGVDNNCDERIDEDFLIDSPCFEGVGSCRREGVRQCRADGQNYVCSVQAAPPGEERCNNLDDDCDGQIDEDFHLADACIIGQGVCTAPGHRVCADDGLSFRCEGELARDPSPELCDLLDNDCNGLIDERNLAGDRLTRSCYSGPDGTENVGLCSSGSQTCAQGVFGPCQNEVVPAEGEDCNEQDDDCDGEVDEEAFGAEQLCDTNLPGLCSFGSTSCIMGDLICLGEKNPQDTNEVCGDGADNDCDGDTDETDPIDGDVCTCTPGSSVACYSGPAMSNGQGLCHAGTQRCNGTGTGYGPCQDEVVPIGEVCDQADNDCNGSLDDVPGAGVACSAGDGVCRREGVMQCGAGGQLRCSVEAANNGQAETCNGLDDDCDGSVDESENGPITRPCYSGPAQTRNTLPCHEGTQACANGQWGACSNEQIPQPEFCNGRDEDCDGSPDDEFADLGDECTEGEGLCQRPGVQECTADGQGIVCNAQAGEPSGEICDEQDNDCDDQIDEGVRNACGVCGPLPVEVCGNEVDDDCDGNVDNGTPEVCDEVDNDCDGRINEGFNNPPGADPQCWGRDKDGDGIFSCSFGSDIEAIDARPGEERGWWRPVPFGGLGVGCDCDDNSGANVNLCPP